MEKEVNKQINPFLKGIFECPVCSNQEYHWRLKDRLIITKSTDFDTRISDFKWKDGKSNGRPTKTDLFHFWECDKCHFSSDYRSYVSLTKNNIVRSKLKKNIEKTRNIGFENAFISKFHSIAKIDKFDLQKILFDNYDNYNKNNEPILKLMLLKRILLAIYNQNILKTTSTYNHIGLASSYIRLSWVYKDLETDKDDRSKELIDYFMNQYQDTPKTIEECRAKAVELYLEGLKKSYSIDTVYKEVALKIVIIRLYLLTGQILKAKRMFIETKTYITSGSEKMLSESKGKLEKDKFDEVLKSTKKAQGTFNAFETQYEKYMERYEEEMISSANNFISDNKSKNREALIELLKKEGFDDKIINKVLPKVVNKSFLSKLFKI